MGSLTTFDFNSHAIRVIDLDGSPWFAAGDVCKVLFDPLHVAIYGPSQRLKSLDADERKLLKRDALISRALIAVDSKVPSMSFISESGLYKLVLRSDKPQAKPFQDWVTKVVLPASRKDGAYIQGHAVGLEMARTSHLTSGAIPVRSGI